MHGCLGSYFFNKQNEATTFEDMWKFTDLYFQVLPTMEQMRNYQRFTVAVFNEYDKVTDWCPTVRLLAILSLAFTRLLVLFPLASFENVIHCLKAKTFSKVPRGSVPMYIRLNSNIFNINCLLSFAYIST